MGRPVQEAQLPVRAGRRPAGRARAAHHLAHRQGPPAAGLCAPRRPGQDRACDELADGLGGLGRGALRPVARPRTLHDRRHQRLQHGRDGEQGPEHLQHEVRAGQPGHRHRRRFQQHRKRGRPRVLPQLDRQPHHLPRLVPAVAQGRPDGVPRPGIQHGPGRRRVGAGRQAHRGRARAAHRAVPRGRRADGAPGAARPVPGDQQLLHRHGVRKGRRGRAHDADAGGARRLRARHEAVLRAARRQRRHLRRLRAGHRRCEPRLEAGAAAAAVQALVQPGRHPAREGRAALRRRLAHVHADAFADLCADARPAAKGAVRHPDAPGAARARRRRADHRPARADRSERDAQLPRPGGRAGALAAARLQRAGRAGLRLHRRAAAHAARARHRPVQHVGSRPAAGGEPRPRLHRPGGPHGRRHPPGRAVRRGDAHDPAPPDAGRRVQGTGADAARRNLPRRTAGRGRSAARARRARGDARTDGPGPVRRLGVGVRNPPRERRLPARPGVVGAPRAGGHGAHAPVPGRAQDAATRCGPARPTSASRTRAT